MDVTVIHAQPDGLNINRGSGSTDPEKLKEVVAAERADIGIAFDGDGDRVLFVDGSGHLLDGDHTLFLLASYFLETRTDFQHNRVVVGTVMGNLGFEKALQRLGVEFVRTGVGDKYVWREMQQRDAILGGEQSGHIILRRFQTTGDGILTALYFLKALAYLGMSPMEVAGQFNLFPQVLRNIEVREKRDLNGWDRLREITDRFNAAHGDNSRLLIRYSGTEPLLRVMIESEHPAVIEENMNKFEQLIRSTIGK